MTTPTTTTETKINIHVLFPEPSEYTIHLSDIPTSFTIAELKSTIKDESETELSWDECILKYKTFELADDTRTIASYNILSNRYVEIEYKIE